MENIFKQEWLREIPLLDNFSIPEEYNRDHFISWEKGFEFNERNLISSGEDHFGKVYDVGEGLVAKVSRKGPFIKRGMVVNKFCPNSGSPYFTEREFWMNKKLKEIEDGSVDPKGHVPRPEGLFLIYNNHLEEYRPAFVMEKIDSLKYDVLTHPGTNEKILEGLNFFNERGINLGDVDSHWIKNNLLSKKDWNIYHIDYMFWGIK